MVGDMDGDIVGDMEASPVWLQEWRHCGNMIDDIVEDIRGQQVDNTNDDIGLQGGDTHGDNVGDNAGDISWLQAGDRFLQFLFCLATLL